MAKESVCIGDLKRVADILNDGENFLLTCHIRPDGDAIGSMLGLGLALEEAGRTVRYFSQDPVPRFLEFLPGTSSIEDSFDEDFVSDAVLVILDCNEPSRIGEQADRLLEIAKHVVVLDHHLGANKHCEQRALNGAGNCEGYICIEASSTSIIVLDLLELLNWPIGKDSATALYTGIVTDTGSFRNSNTNKKAFLTAARLLEAGVDSYYVANKIYQSVPRQRLDLLGLVLKTLEVHEQGLFAMIHVTPKMFEITGTTEDDASDFISYARCIETVELAAFVKEFQPGVVSVSLRSKHLVNCAEIARHFGGGGHFHAAGFRTVGSAHEIRESVIEVVRDYFEKHGSQGVNGV